VGIKVISYSIKIYIRWAALARAFIETEKFPSHLISIKAAKEKGPGRPPFWEMVFWWTRKPLITARAVIAGAILPAETSKDTFEAIIRLNANNPHREQPIISQHYRELFKTKSLLDPFAGFGNIPLEAIRLGLKEVVATELLPTAVVFLKAILEYPTKYGKKLVDDVKKWGEWITKKLAEDPDIKELYDEDAAVYIGSWEIKCPHCGKYTPLVGNWWLARVKNGSKYTRLVYMKPVKRNEEIEIEVTDLNKKYTSISKAKVESTKIIINGKVEHVPAPNIEARKNQAICLHCQNIIRYIDPETGKHYIDTKNLPTMIKNRIEPYIKYALKQWNKNLEEYFIGKMDLNQLLQSSARPKLLVKLKIMNKDLVFEPATKEDNEKIWRALEKLKQIWGDPDIPTEPMPTYDQRNVWIAPYGFDKWFKMFNPHQLLTHVKLVKLIREAGKRIEKEKIKEGQNQEDAFRYAEAVTTYLAIALCKYADFNSVSTRWNPGWLKFEESLSVRGIAMMWSWSDSSPFASFTGTWTRNLENIINGLSYLVSAVNGSFSRVRALLDDATTLSKLSNEKFDVIATDPPYYDDVPYSELSDFYFVWLKRALSNIKDKRLVPRFHRELFFKRVGALEIPISTQWESFAKREISFNVARYHDEVDESRKSVLEEYALERYRELLSSAFRNLASRLKDDGILVTYYNHTNPDAWRDLLWAGWSQARLEVTATWPLLTESPQAVTRRGKIRLDTSLVIAWRKKKNAKGEVFVNEVIEEALKEAREWASKIWKYHRGLDAFIGIMGRVLSVVTRYDKIIFPEKRDWSKLVPDVEKERIDYEKRIMSEIVYPATGRGLIEYLSKLYDAPVRSAGSILYLLFKILFTPPEEGSKSGIAREKRLESSDMVLLSLAAGASINDFKTKRIIKEKRSQNKVEYILLEPKSTKPSDIEALLRSKGLNPILPKPASSVDVLHLLEYYVATLSKDAFLDKLNHLRERVRTDYIDEAIGLAKILAHAMPSQDPEGILCTRILEYLGLRAAPKPARTLDEFIKQS